MDSQKEASEPEQGADSKTTAASRELASSTHPAEITSRPEFFRRTTWGI